MILTRIEVDAELVCLRNPSGLTMLFERLILEPMDIDRAATAFADLFSELHLRLYQRLDPRAWRPSPEALMVLHHLSSTGPLTVTEAARHLDRSQAAVSELLTRLERRGLLARMEDERDRRRHLVWLTAEGLELLRRTNQLLSEDLLEGALEHLSPNERSRLVELLRKVRDAAAPANHPKEKYP